MFKNAQHAASLQSAAEAAMHAAISGKHSKTGAASKKKGGGDAIGHLVKPCGSLAALEQLLDQACATLGLTPEDAVELSNKMPMGQPIDALLVAA